MSVQSISALRCRSFGKPLVKISSAFTGASDFHQRKRHSCKSLILQPKNQRLSFTASESHAYSNSRNVQTQYKKDTDAEPEQIEEEFDLCEVAVSKEQRVKPGNLFDLARANFEVELEGAQSNLGSSVNRTLSKLGLLDKTYQATTIPDCLGFILDDKAVQERDEAREKDPEEPTFIRWFYDVTVMTLDFLYEGKPIQKFWVLEVIARIPYFAYVSVLHLYESLGWWQNTDLAKLHFAEAYAEQHHLLIMESLGGNNAWTDRFVAQHTAVLYFWVIVGSYLVSPRWSYYFMQLVEQHAYDTYSEFVENNTEALALYPPPNVAVQFYRDGDMYMFDEFHAGGSNEELRRPPVDNLLQVFENIRDDELEHVKTMVRCQDYEWLATSQVSPHSKKRQDWAKWAEEINEASDKESHQRN